MNQVPTALTDAEPQLLLESQTIGGKEKVPMKYSAERREAILKKLLAPHNRTVSDLAREEGIFAGVSSGGAVHAAIKLAEQHDHAVIVAIICDRGDRYLSSGIF